MKMTPVKELSAEYISTTPQSYDWTAGYGETWEFHVACRCEKCGATITNERCGGTHSEIDSDSDCDGYVESSEGPMMSYFYPMPDFRGDVENASKEIANLPLCIVEFTDSGDYALALTGGGMDLSWQICEAFMRLGYLPPFHFELPGMSGRGTSTRDRWIIAGCRRSAQFIKQNAGSRLRRMRSQFKPVAA